MDDNATGKLNLAALGVAATGLITVLGGLSLTGTVGRVLRNEPQPIAWALVAVLVGAALLAAAGLPATGKPVEVAFSLIGLELTLAGLVIAAVTGVRSAGTGERPAITAQLGEDGLHLTGKVTVGNLSSDARFVTLVRGLGASVKDKQPTKTELSRADAGPDGDGKVDLAIDVHVPAGRYEKVEVAGWTVAKPADDATTFADEAKPPATTCDPPKGEKDAEMPTSAGRACIALPLAPVAPSPQISAHWGGTKAETQRIEVQVATGNAPDKRVAVVVKRRTKDRKKYVRFYRAILAPDGTGKLDTKLQVPVPPGARRVCVGAAFVARDAFPKFPCHGKVGEFERADQSVVQLRQPDG